MLQIVVVVRAAVYAIMSMSHSGTRLWQSAARPIIVVVVNCKLFQIRDNGE